jgi:diguanylate cyclase (GGDEF)-like protein
MSQISSKVSSLGFQFGLLMSLILVLSMSGNAWLTYIDNVRIADKTIETRLESLAQLFIGTTTESLLISDFITINENLAIAANQPDIVFTSLEDQQQKNIDMVINENGDLYQAVLKQQEAIVKEAFVNGFKDDLRVVLRTYPVTFRNTQIAEFTIGIDRRNFDAEAANHLYNNLLLTLLIAVLAGLAIYAIFNQRILKPIQLLKKAAYEIAHFNLDERIRIHGHNELSELGDSFNKMTGKLSEALSDKQDALVELSKLNETLEERIHKRTRELQRLNSQITHQALHDPLTLLPNRSLIMERLRQAIRYAHRKNMTMAVFMLDLNRFKEVNDTLGHPVGDKVLIEVANRIPNVLRESDTIGRLGGDEFVILLPESDLEDAKTVANKVLEEFSKDFKVAEHSLSVGTSIGIAMYPDHGDSADSLIQKADVALYVAKRSSDKFISIYNEDEDKHSLTRLLLISDLKEAIENDGLSLVYQPQVDIRDKTVCGVEALCRWHHPTYGFIPPDEFISMAEDAGLIKSLTLYVLEKVTQQIVAWQKQSLEIRVAVNLSMGNLMDLSLLDKIPELLDKYQVPTKKLKLEITESMIMSDPDKVAELLASDIFSDMNVSIDDFGTGYSSLSHLKRLPVNELKIDKSFVINMLEDHEDISIVDTIIQLAKNLGLNIVAEGVEELDTVRVLSSMGCHVVQGYYFAKPTAPEKLIGTIEEIYQKLDKDLAAA